MFPRANNNKPIGGDDVSTESSLKLLLASPAAVKALLDYLEKSMHNAEEEFKKASVQAVFEPDNRVDAIHKHGIIKGLQQVYDRLNQLVMTGK